MPLNASVSPSVEPRTAPSSVQATSSPALLHSEALATFGNTASTSAAKTTTIVFFNKDRLMSRRTSIISRFALPGATGA